MADRTIGALFWSFVGTEQIRDIIDAEIKELERTHPGAKPHASVAIRSLILKGAKVKRRKEADED